jgi:hypothetical protein
MQIEDTVKTIFAAAQTDDVAMLHAEKQAGVWKIVFMHSTRTP